jgi:hypothetical protein
MRGGESGVLLQQKPASSFSEGSQCMHGMRGDAGEVWMNVIVAGTGDDREV